MFLRLLSILALGGWLVGFVRAEDTANHKPQALEGYWQGFWGGGEAGGVIRLPVLAEMLVRGDHVKMLRFPSVGSVTGTIRVDEAAGKMHITRKADDGKPPMPAAIVCAYEFKGDKLTLTLGDDSRIALERHRVDSHAMANTHIELCSSKGIDESGNLIVARFTLLQDADNDAPYFNPQETKLKTSQAIILLVQNEGVKKISLSEARTIFRESKPVALAYGHGASRPGFFAGDMFKDVGEVPADNDAAYKTFGSALRPGTLIFILSPRDSAPAPYSAICGRSATRA